MKDFIKFNCNACDFKVKTPLINAGGNGRCPNCRALNIVPEEKEYIIDFAELEKIGN